MKNLYKYKFRGDTYGYEEYGSYKKFTFKYRRIAWVVIKPEVKNKEKELIKRMKNNNLNSKTKTSYVLEEAQTVIADYLKEYKQL